MVVSPPTRARTRLCRQGIVKLSDHENEIARLMTFRRFQTDEIGCRQKLVRAI